jgi:osmoprotectant transport system substrate-binding protein
MRRWWRGPLLSLVAVTAALATPVAASPAAASNGARALSDATVVVGSFDFAESRLLAEIYAQALEGDGIRVRRELGIGPRELVLPALTRGLVELVPEYSGAALRFASLGAEQGTDTESTRARLARRLAPRDVEVLTPSPAEDVDTFVVTRETATAHGLRTLSDLAAVADDLVFGGPPECASRPECLAGLERVYGISFRETLSLDAGGPATRQALRSRAVDVALLFSTDPAVDDEFVALVDDRALQPAQNVTPVVRAEVLERFGPGLAARLDAVSAELTTESLRALNGEMAGGASSRAVAQRWLRSVGLR